MIISKTPYRISFFGGSTDLQPWYEKHGGAVLTASINKYCHVLVRGIPRFLGWKYQVVWSKFEQVNTLREIQHGGVRGCLQFMNIDPELPEDYGFEVNHAGEMPARSGLGTSSCFTVGMLNALYAMRQELVSHARLATDAITVEQNVLHETVGIQDQIQCAYGGINYIQIEKNGKFGIYPVVLRDNRTLHLESHLMLFFTGLVRNSSQIAQSLLEVINTNEEAMTRMQDMAIEGWKILVDENKSIDEFGALLHEGWMLKHSLSPMISNPEVDSAYAKAIAAGALGGKLLGAGGGGFLLIFAKPEHQIKIREALKPMIYVPVKFEYKGSQIIHAS